jgi:methyl-accepting chemotaxis protein
VSAHRRGAQKIAGHVQSINSNVKAMATASREQSVGITEINTAVNQMDQVTQQNAAMVEETETLNQAISRCVRDPAFLGLVGRRVAA